MIERQQYCVLPDNISNRIHCCSTAVIFHLYYEEMITNVLEYIDRIPAEVDVYVISPKKVILSVLKEECGDKHLTMINKPNRGRDVAALLISCRDIVFKYRYICFLHDKKPIRDGLSKDTNLWLMNLWENMLASEDYIRNVYKLFVDHDEYGLLLPPERYGEYFNDWLKSKWGRNFETTRDLAYKLRLNANVELEYPSFSLGTTLWCRTEVLKKLIDYPWKYEEFQDEPMDDDGTISHAIERIFPYLANDAGYCTRTVVSTGYCSGLLSYAQSASRAFVSELENMVGVSRISDIHKLNDVKNQVVKAKNAGKKVFIYGAGNEGKYCLRYIRSLGIEPEAFVESNTQGLRYVEGLVTRKASDVSWKNDDVLVIISPYCGAIKKEIAMKLKILGVEDYIFWKNEYE